MQRERGSTWRWQTSLLWLLSMLAAIYSAQYARQVLRAPPASAPQADPPCTVAVVGGGLAGLSAAVEAALYFSRHNLSSCTVTLIDKEPRIGGNSAKASSGINAAHTREQAAAGISDSVEAFAADTSAAGGGLGQPELLRALAQDSVQATQHCCFYVLFFARNDLQALDFLRSHGVDLSLLSQCGGHSQPRTHRPLTTSSTGVEVIKALSSAAARARVRVLNGSRVDQIQFCGGLSSPAGHRVCGVKLAAAASAAVAPPSPVDFLGAAAVVIATGGFGANKSALAQYVPHLKDLPTTNGAFAQGDGIRLGLAAGGVLRDMNHVQVHPTSFVDPAAPAHPVKWLAPEALRGSGALLLDAGCSRFVNELGYRSAVSDAIVKAGFDRGGYRAAFMVANVKVEQLFNIAGIYKSKGFVVSYPNAQTAAAAMGCEASALEQTLSTYAQPHSPDAFGKTVFPAVFNASEPLLIMTVTPAVHYTIGGLSIDASACMLSAAGSCVPGVFAAGEVTGGVHGNNRLAGQPAQSFSSRICAHILWQGTGCSTMWCSGAGQARRRLRRQQQH